MLNDVKIILIFNSKIFEADVKTIGANRQFIGNIYGLNAYTDYLCSAQVLNEAGWSRESLGYVFTTLEDCKFEITLFLKDFIN